MTKIIKILILIIGFGLSATPMAEAQDLQFSKLKQVRKLLRMDKQGDVQAIITDLYKQKAKRDKEKTDVPLVADGPAFDDSYLDGKKPVKKDSTEYYFLTGLLKHHQFEKENTKLYLRQKPDTVAYFSRLYEMLDAFEHCFPAVSNHKRESEEAKGMLQQYKDNLMRGGNFYLAKQDLKNASRFFHKFILLNNKELVASPDTLLNRAYYNMAYVASQMKEYESVLRYGNALVRRGDASEEVDLLICDALSKLERIDEWKEALQQALTRHPNYFYFYAALIDYYIANNALDKALKYADDLLKNDPMSGVKNFVKGYVYQHIGDYRNAIIWQEICDRLTPGVPENLSALGYNYVTVAEEYSASLRGNYMTPEAKKELTGYYTKAKQYLEECRKVAPDSPQFWAPALYKVYYHLNDGDALDEIEAILRDVE